MVGFLIAALIAFGLVNLGAMAGEAALTRLRRLRTIRWETLAATAALLALAAALLAAAFADDLILRLETSDGFRAFLGAIFGLMAGFLVRGWRRAERDGGGADAPWWARASGLIPLALTGLFVFAVIAPRGEFDLGFLRSVKTPFVEAQFNRNETEHRLEIESEPEGFFTLGRNGLGEALYLAWADLYYWDALVAAGGGPFDLDTATEKRREAAIALEFMTKVLQPIAACIRQADALLGDQSLATDVLGRIGHRLARALILAHEADRVRFDPKWTEAEHEKARGRRDDHNAAAVAQLTGLHGAIGDLIDDEIAPLMPVLDATSHDRAAYRSNLCDRSDLRWGHPGRSLAATDPAILHEALRLPATIHASSMFFLWSGNPRAAATVLSLAPRGGDRAARHPGIDFTLGFTMRWTDAKNPKPSAYLDLWQRSMDIVEARLAALETAHGDTIAGCRGRRATKRVLASIYPLTEAPDADDGAAVAALLAVQDGEGAWERKGLASTPAGQICGDGDALPCKIRLAYGYHRHYLHKLRNHLVYETARELMTGRDMVDDPTLLERQARLHADGLEAFVDADGYRRGNCETLIVTRVAAGGGWEEAVTQTDAVLQYAVNLDSIGLLTLAAAVRDDDESGIERALGYFERSLDMGRSFGDGIRLVVRDHRRQARSFLGMEE